MGSSNIFDTALDEESDSSLTEDHDELDQYLNADNERDVDDPLMWWHQHRHTYPHLSRMARDYLTIPGMYPYHWKKLLLICI